MKYFTRLSKGRLTAIGAGITLLGILTLVPWRLAAAPRTAEQDSVADAKSETDASGRRNPPQVEARQQTTNQTSASVMRVIQLQHADPIRVIAITRPALDPLVQVVADERTRSLIVTAPNKALSEIAIERRSLAFAPQ